jgi:hypothetical protein
MSTKTTTVDYLAMPLVWQGAREWAMARVEAARRVGTQYVVYRHEGGRYASVHGAESADDARRIAAVIGGRARAYTIGTEGRVCSNTGSMLDIDDLVLV